MVISFLIIEISADFRSISGPDSSGGTARPLVCDATKPSSSCSIDLRALLEQAPPQNLLAAASDDPPAAPGPTRNQPNLLKTNQNSQSGILLRIRYRVVFIFFHSFHSTYEMPPPKTDTPHRIMKAEGVVSPLSTPQPRPSVEKSDELALFVKKHKDLIWGEVCREEELKYEGTKSNRTRHHRTGVALLTG